MDHHQDAEAEEEEMFNPADAEEEVPEGNDVEMDSGDDEENDDADMQAEENLEEIQLQNDSTAHFDGHKDSIFCVAQCPLDPSLIVTGGGDDTAYLWRVPEASDEDTRPVLPASYETNPTPAQPIERKLSLIHI